MLFILIQLKKVSLYFFAKRYNTKIFAICNVLNIISNLLIMKNFTEKILLKRNEDASHPTKTLTNFWGEDISPRYLFIHLFNSIIMFLAEIKAALGVSRIPFEEVDAAYPDWRSFFDGTKREQYVIATALFDRLKGGEAVDLFLNTSTEPGPSGKSYTKHLIGEQKGVDYL